ncbi:MAG: hypothetical protein HQP61_10595 [Peptococcaceae bacterium]|nr:hypothetical protein [Candidatus Syntrophopropionicum ammoniitolerans]
MLRGILRIISRDGYISRSQLAKELNILKDIVDEGIMQLLRRGYLLEENTGEGCATFCVKCPFARNCSKEIVKTFKISAKGERYLKNR